MSWRSGSFFGLTFLLIASFGVLITIYAVFRREKARIVPIIDSREVMYVSVLPSVENLTENYNDQIMNSTTSMIATTSLST